jgi:uncharacterized membrane protein SpoIIM required for sporulation
MATQPRDRGPLTQEDRVHLKRLGRLLRRTARRSALDEAELRDLPLLYRHACSVLARLETEGSAPAVAAEVRKRVSAAHEVLHRGTLDEPVSVLRRLVRFLFAECPRAIRAEWRLLVTTLLVFYGLAIGAYAAVLHDMDLASSLLGPEQVDVMVDQLQHTPPGEPYRGNFTFGIGESPGVAGYIPFHNMGVGVLFFASALVPPFFVLILTANALMVGSYTGVAGHWGQDGAISSILWCHGVIELQCIVLAGVAGLVLVRAIVRPGPWTRHHALVLESKRSWRLLAPTFPLLFLSGQIEAFVSPHAGLGVRLSTAVLTGVLLLAWVLLGGRGERAA